MHVIERSRGEGDLIERSRGELQKILNGDLTEEVIYMCSARGITSKRMEWAAVVNFTVIFL
jgi:hypothetical protein